MSRVEGLDMSCDKYPFSDLLSESEGLFSYWKVTGGVRVMTRERERRGDGDRL